VFLAIDIGNTNVTLGVFAGEHLRATWRIATVHDRLSDEYGILLLQLLRHRSVQPEDISGIAIASVVPAAACFGK
jgi:type III pantothenate kinase